MVTMFNKTNLSLAWGYKGSFPLNCFWEQLFWDSHGWSRLRPGRLRSLPRAGLDTKQFSKLMVERQLVPVMALLPGDPEFGARNIWDWDAGGTPEGVRCRRVEQRFMDAGDFLLDWLACVFTATKSGDRENSGYEHSELVPAQPGSSQSGACWSCCLTATLTIPAPSPQDTAGLPPHPRGHWGSW